MKYEKDDNPENNESEDKPKGDMDIDMGRIKSDPEYRRVMMAKKLRKMADKMESGEVEVDVEVEGGDASCPCYQGKPCPKGLKGDGMMECPKSKAATDAAGTAPDCKGCKGADTPKEEKEPAEAPEKPKGEMTTMEHIQAALDLMKAEKEAE